MIDMRIEQYHITSDQRNFIVAIAKMDGDEPACEVTDKGKKVYLERNLGYYRNLALAFQAIARDMLQNGAGPIMTVDDYAERAETIETTLAAAAREYGQKVQEADNEVRR